VIVVVTDPPPAPARVTRDATVDMTLGPLDEAAVRAHLAPFAAVARPAVAGEELDRYVEAVRREPGLLRPLERVLAADAEVAA
jgi:hypothetical protein